MRAPGGSSDRYAPPENFGQSSARPRRTSSADRSRPSGRKQRATSRSCDVLPSGIQRTIRPSQRRIISTRAIQPQGWSISGASIPKRRMGIPSISIVSPSTTQAWPSIRRVGFGDGQHRRARGGGGSINTTSSSSDGRADNSLGTRRKWGRGGSGEPAPTHRTIRRTRPPNTPSPFSRLQDDASANPGAPQSAAQPMQVETT